MGCVVAAGAAAFALDQYLEAKKERQFVNWPADPKLLSAPDFAHWRADPLILGRPAPRFNLEDVRTGARMSLDEFRSRPVVLLLSSFGCNVFCAELGRLTDLHKKYKNKVAFLFIAIRDAGHPDPKSSPPAGAPRPGESAHETRLRLVREGAEYLALPFPALLDADGKTENAYAAFPKRLVIVSADGRIVYDGGRGAAGGPSEWDLRKVEEHLRTALVKARTTE